MTTLSMDIQGKVALITGSAKRIGRAVAVKIARRGGRIAIHFRSDENEGKETLNLVRNVGGDGSVFRAELTDSAAVEQMCDEIGSVLGGLDILVNNASIFSPGTVDQTTSEEWMPEGNIKIIQLHTPKAHQRLISCEDFLLMMRVMLLLVLRNVWKFLVYVMILRWVLWVWKLR